MLSKQKVVTYDLNIGQLMVTQYPAEVACFGLGSCVGVFIYDVHKKVAGGAHIMLPGDGENANEGGHEYATTALRDLISMMKRIQSPVVLQAKIVGGANVIAYNSFKIGERNAKAVREILEEHNVTIVKEDLGGIASRTARFYFPDNTVEVRTSDGQKYSI